MLELLDLLARLPPCRRRGKAGAASFGQLAQVTQLALGRPGIPCCHRASGCGGVALRPLPRPLAGDTGRGKSAAPPREQLGDLPELKPPLALGPRCDRLLAAREPLDQRARLLQLIEPVVGQLAMSGRSLERCRARRRAQTTYAVASTTSSSADLPIARLPRADQGVGELVHEHRQASVRGEPIGDRNPTLY